MMLNNKKILYVLMTSAFATLTIILCMLIEQYAKKSLSSEIQFNYESGFYDEPIQVEMSTGRSYFITYTLDGSTPTIASTRYEGPIAISDASENENVWAMMKETSLYYFLGWYKTPEYKIDKCALLRAAAFDYNGNQVNDDFREYFIGFEERVGYEEMYNLCVVTDPENLFGTDSGIYSVGEYFEGKIESCEIYDMYHDGFWENDGAENWRKKGKNSERPAFIELFSPEGTLISREACGIRIRGGDSRQSPQKPIGFYARKKYSGNDNFSFCLSDDMLYPKSFRIHNSGDDFRVKLMDYVIYKVLSTGEMSFEISPVVPCNLFIDGEYWGAMYLMDNITCDDLGYNKDISSDNIVLIKSGKVKYEGDDDNVTEEELERWMNLLDFIRYNDMSIPENYEYVCSMIDIENFADYVATEIYVANADWHIKNNSAFWRTLKTEKGNPYADGKYRCALFDVNWSFESEETMTIEHYNEWDLCDAVHDLCKNEDFKKIYLDRIDKIENLFTLETVSKIIDEWTEVMEEPIKSNYKRFGIATNPDEEICEEKKQIMNFCANRPKEIKKVNEWMFR